MLTLKDYRGMEETFDTLLGNIVTTEDSVVDVTVKQSLISWLDIKFNTLPKEALECIMGKYVVNFKISGKEIMDLIALPSIDKELVEAMKTDFDGDNFLNKLKVLDVLLSEIKVIDIACGSGKFLVSMLDLVAKMRYNINLMLGNSVSLFMIKKDLVTNSIYGCDIDSKAVETTRLALVLNTLKEINKEGLTDHALLCKSSDFIGVDFNITNLNSLSVKDNEDDLKIETEFCSVWYKNRGFDIVLGNPTCQNVGNYKVEFDKQAYKGYQKGVSTSCLFLERGLNLVNHTGVVALVSSDKWLGSKNSDNVRQYIKFNSKVIGNITFEGERVMSGIDICVTFLTKYKDEVTSNYVLWHHGWENKTR